MYVHTVYTYIHVHVHVCTYSVHVHTCTCMYVQCTRTCMQASMQYIFTHAQCIMCINGCKQIAWSSTFNHSEGVPTRKYTVHNAMHHSGRLAGIIFNVLHITDSVVLERTVWIMYVLLHTCAVHVVCSPPNCYIQVHVIYCTCSSGSRRAPLSTLAWGW